MKALDSAIESLDQTIRGYDQENCIDFEIVSFTIVSLKITFNLGISENSTYKVLVISFRSHHLVRIL